MKVFVAGASGAIGRPLVRQLVEAGHEVTGTTRQRGESRGDPRGGGDGGRLRRLRRGGARGGGEGGRARGRRQPADQPAARSTTRKRPRSTSRPTGSAARAARNLLAAARAAGARRFVTQSIAFLYAPEGDWVKDEEARPFDDAPGHFAQAVEAMTRPRAGSARRRGDRGARPPLRPVLRPRHLLRPRRPPRPGSRASGASRSSAPAPASPPSSTSTTPPRRPSPPSTAAAPASTTSATTSRRRCASGCPVYAEALGAKPPRRCPLWLARLVAGRLAVANSASTCAAPPTPRRSASWAGSPRYPSWRQGFREALG